MTSCNCPPCQKKNDSEVRAYERGKRVGKIEGLEIARSSILNWRFYDKDKLHPVQQIENELEKLKGEK